jgi:hypothetical protein
VRIVLDRERPLLRRSVARRLGDVDEPAPDQFGICRLEEGQQQRAEYAAIDVASVMMMILW